SRCLTKSPCPTAACRHARVWLSRTARAVSAKRERTVALLTDAAVAREHAGSESLRIQLDDVGDERAGLAPIDDAYDSYAEQHVDKVEPQVGRLYADLEIGAQAQLAADPAVGVAPAVDDGGRIEFHVVGVVRHDGVDVAPVPGIAPAAREYPCRLLGPLQHQPPETTAQASMTIFGAARPAPPLS